MSNPIATPKSPLKMTHDRVLAQRVDITHKSALILPDGADDPARYKMVVVAVGPGRVTEYGVTQVPPCKVGDVIVFIPGKGIPFTLHGNTYLALDASQIMGIEDAAVIKELEEAAGSFAHNFAKSAISG